MYTRQEASQQRKKFWTSFGQYMRPIPGADGEEINWLNYKTGKKHIYLRMDADTEKASIAIELRHPDPAERLHYFDQLQAGNKILEELMNEKWEWHLHAIDDYTNVISKIGKMVKGVNVFNEQDWPSIISFLKPRLIALDEFWSLIKNNLH